MLLVAIPMWITEVAPPHGRGILAEIHAWMAVVGYLVAGYVGVGFFYYHPLGGSEWRGPLALAAFFPLVTLACLPFLPESPRWLIGKGHNDQAFKILESLHRRKGESENVYAHAEFIQIQKQVELDRSLDSSWKVILTRPSYRKRALIACTVLSGIYSSGTLTITSTSVED